MCVCVCVCVCVPACVCVCEMVEHKTGVCDLCCVTIITILARLDVIDLCSLKYLI